MSDINLIYSGGSGGFLLLHLLLLSNCYTIAFNRADITINQQWEIKDPAKWKESEIWPSNADTLALDTNRRKIYFYCGKELSDVTLPGKLAVIYTDYASQQSLAYYKKAHWYHLKHNPAFDFKFTAYIELLRSWRDHYNNIKDPGWPKCLSFRHIHKLPKNIQQEILNDPYTEYFLNYQYQADTQELNGTLLYKQAAEYINSADIAVKLQDVVNSHGEILVGAFDIPPITDQQRELITHWCSLHPPELLNRIGIAN